MVYWESYFLVIVGNATGIYGADIDDTVPVEAESEMTDSGKEEQQEITQEKTQDSDDPEPSAEESQEISHESEEKENPEKDEADKIPGCSIWKTARKR